MHYDGLSVMEKFTCAAAAPLSKQVRDNAQRFLHRKGCVDLNLRYGCIVGVANTSHGKKRCCLRPAYLGHRSTIGIYTS
jgi:hypothetical protein